MEQERKPQNKGLRIAAGVVFALLCAAQIAYLAVSLRYEWSLAAFPSARRVLLQTGIRQLFPILIHAFLAIRMFAREQMRLSLPAGIACAAVFVLSAVGLFAFQTFRYDSAPALLYVVKHVLPVLIFALVAALWLFSRKASLFWDWRAKRSSPRCITSRICTSATRSTPVPLRPQRSAPLR